MTVLSHQTILARCKGPYPLVRPYLEKQIRSASYDLRLGEEFYLSPVSTHGRGWIQILTLGVDSKVLVVPPHGVVLVRTLENVAMPNDMVGHLSLKLDILLTGLIMASQSQIDAGYRGPIYALLYNLGSEPVNVAFGTSLLRLEFALLDHETKKPYDGDFKSNFTLGDVVEHPITSSLHAMDAQVRRTQRIVWGTVATIGLGMLALVLGLFVPFAQSASEAKADAANAARVVDTLRARLEAEQQARSDLEAKVADRRGRPDEAGR